MLKRQLTFPVTTAAAATATATASSSIFVSTRDLGHGFAPVWTGPLRDNLPKWVDLKRPGGLPAVREDQTKAHTHDPYADKPITYTNSERKRKQIEDSDAKKKRALTNPMPDPRANPERDHIKEIPPFAKKEPAYFETGARAPNLEPEPGRSYHNAHEGIDDMVSNPEFKTSFGNFEIRPTGTGHVGVLRYHNYRRIPPTETVPQRDCFSLAPQSEGHHPFYDYSGVAGHKFGTNSGTSQNIVHWDLKVATHSLYRACLRGLPIMKNFFYLTLPFDRMKDRVRERFERNKYVKDPDAARHLLNMGWQDYTECITLRKPKHGVHKFFHDSEDVSTLIAYYTEEEGKLMEERSFWNGEEQRRNGPYDGHWSWIGKKNEEDFKKLAGRVPMSWSEGKGYFELFKCDGTNYWEKNLDYEGWYIKNMDPDRRAARKEIQTWVDSGYSTPKHYASKNRRGYRRLVKDIENIMKSTPHEMYAESREMLFQFWVREWCPESNRISAEKKLARHDDEVFTTKFDELEKPIKQAMREMPNPRLWRTDAFYLRVRYLQAFYEYNWAKVPIGASFEKLYNDWVSVDRNYAILCSPQFEALKKDKRRNPMAKTWADFYREFDPDVESTRRLPWYHAEFNYDRRYHWDERCMRMKKWVDSGDIDGTNSFFDAEIDKFEQHINRYETMKQPGAVEYKYCAPRYVQLYRGLNKRMDVALVNQIGEYLASSKHGLKASGATVSETTAALQKANDDLLANFNFQVPTVIYPDDSEQPQLSIDGRASTVQTSA